MTKLPVTCECKVPYKKVHGLCLKHEGKCGKVVHAGFNPCWCANKVPCDIHPEKPVKSKAGYVNSDIGKQVGIFVKVNKLFANPIVKKLEEDISSALTDTEESWEERFDQEYSSCELCNVVSKKDSDRLKSFIRVLLKEEKDKMSYEVLSDEVLSKVWEGKKEKLRKKVEELKENNQFTPCHRCRNPMSYQNVCTCSVFRSAIYQVLEILK